MGQCTSGFSGGVPVGPTPVPPAGFPQPGLGPNGQPQLAGVLLTLAGDYAVIFISGTSPQGADTGGIFSITGTFPGGANLICEFVPDPYNWANSNWANNQLAIRNDTNQYTNGAFSVSPSTALQINPGFVSNLYAVRLRLLTTLSSGAVLVSGSTSPGSPVGVDQQILASVVANTQANLALLLAMSDVTGHDPSDYYVRAGNGLV